jgi:hypothetical protein
MTDIYGSGVLPISNGSEPPTNEQGAISNIAAAVTLPQWGTMIEAMDELETNPKLSFPSSIATYHNMRTDPQVQGLLTGATWPLMRMRWFLDPNGAKDEIVQKLSTDLNLPIEKEQPPDPNMLNVPLGLNGQPPPGSVPTKGPDPEFHQRRTQNRFKFLDHLETALDAIAYGFMLFEQVGMIGDDGKFHYTKLALRPPSTVTEIHLAQDGGVDYVRQGGLIDNKLDINRLVFYSFQKRGANWHGRSMLRGCYAPWLLKDRAMRVGVMNIQRAGVGTPIATGHPGASEADLRVLSEMTQRLIAGDRSGGAIPYGATLKLVGVEGGQPDTVEFVKLMNEEMARSFFQMFMQLGQTTSGSRALGSTFVDYHKLVIEYIAQWFTLIFNEHVIEDDVEWNYGPDEEFAPLLKWEWDDKGSDQNPEGPTASRNPSKQLQEMSLKNKIQVDEKTKNAMFE